MSEQYTPLEKLDLSIHDIKAGCKHLETSSRDLTVSGPVLMKMREALNLLLSLRPDVQKISGPYLVRRPRAGKENDRAAS